MSVCRYCASDFLISKDQQEMLDRFEVPAPQACPSCRLQRRYAMRNERVLYQRKCDLTGDAIISIFASDSPYIVYSQDEWWSDKWDQLQYGQDFDFDRPFFDQLKDLQFKQPRLALLAKDSENSEFTNHSARNKNCYLSFSTIECENVFYGMMVNSSRDIALVMP